MAESPKINIKIALVGDCGVGKSSIALRYTKNQFINNYISNRKKWRNITIRYMGYSRTRKISFFRKKFLQRCFHYFIGL